MRYKKLLALVIAILIAESILTGLIPHSRGYLFGFLETKMGPIYIALGIYFANYLLLDGFQAIKGYFILKLALLFRTERTKSLNSIEMKKGLDNAPQRIQEDVKYSYLSRFTVYAEYFVSGTIVLQLLVINLSEPVLLVSALGYAAFSVYIAVKFNPRLTKAEKMVQKEEASYRASLAEDITNITRLPLANKADLVAGLIKLQYLLFTKLQLGFVTVLPYLVLIPSLMDGTITLGTLMKHQATFALIVVNASILIHYYMRLVQGKASEQRVKELEEE